MTSSAEMNSACGNSANAEIHGALAPSRLWRVPSGPPRRLLQRASKSGARVRCKGFVRIQRALKNTGAPGALLLQSLARHMQTRLFWCRGVLRKYSSGGLSPRAPCTGGLSAPQTPCSKYAKDSVYGNRKQSTQRLRLDDASTHHPIPLRCNSLNSVIM